MRRGSDEGRVLLCGTCIDVRGIANTELMDGARRSTMDEFAARNSRSR